MYARPPGRLVLLDNYDSYTYNLYQLLLGFVGADGVVVVRADAFPSWAALEAALGPLAGAVISKIRRQRPRAAPSAP